MKTSISSKNHSFWSLLFKAFLGIQFCLWFYVNLRYQIIHNYDQIEQIFRSIHLSSHEALSLSYWNDLTGLDLNCSSLLAILVYYITRNVLFSFSIANILNILLFIVILYMLLAHCGIKSVLACLLVGITLIPFSCTGQSAYSSLLFFDSSQCFYNVLIPIWLLELMSSSNPTKKWPTVIHAALFLIVCFITSVFDGLYTFLCGLVPIILCDMALRLRLDTSAVKDHIVLPSLACFVCLAGYAIHRISVLDANAVPLSIVSLSSFTYNLDDNISAIFQLFGALHAETISVTSFIGILSAAKVFLVIVVVIAGLIPLKLLSSENSYENVCQMRRNNLPLYCSFIACWNFFILQITESPVIYHLIGLIPLILSASITLSQWIETGGFEKNLTTGIIAFAVVCLAAGCWAVFLSSVRDHYADQYQELQISADYGNISVFTASSTINTAKNRIG